MYFLLDVFLFKFLGFWGFGIHDQRVEVPPEIEREVEIVVELRRLRAVREAVLAAVRRDRVEPDPLHKGLGGKRTYST